ncbi:MAG TPA: hypothetical protein VN632_00100 [Stellaceae bacterium]|nr:hypothetical protein [Stellaceae bacterium]
MKFLTNEKTELVDVSAVERDGDTLVLRGKIFGTMPMTARLTPEEARKAFKLLNVGLVLFLLTFMFRKSAK